MASQIGKHIRNAVILAGILCLFVFALAFYGIHRSYADGCFYPAYVSPRAQGKDEGSDVMLQAFLVTGIHTSYWALLGSGLR